MDASTLEAAQQDPGFRLRRFLKCVSGTDVLSPSYTVCALTLYGHKSV